MRSGTTVATLRMTSAPVLLTLVILLLLLLYCVNNDLLTTTAQTEPEDAIAAESLNSGRSSPLSAAEPLLSLQYNLGATGQ